MYELNTISCPGNNKDMKLTQDNISVVLQSFAKESSFLLFLTYKSSDTSDLTPVWSGFFLDIKP
jgi:hypothetical protein